MDFFDELVRITRAHCEAMGYTKAAAGQIADGQASGRQLDPPQPLTDNALASGTTGSSAPAAAPTMIFITCAACDNPKICCEHKSCAKCKPLTVAPIDPASPLYQSLRKPVPQIWTPMGGVVYRHNMPFCWCDNEEAARFIANRLNAFDANLTERNAFQMMYLKLRDEEKE